MFLFGELSDNIDTGHGRAGEKGEIFRFMFFSHLPEINDVIVAVSRLITRE